MECRTWRFGESNFQKFSRGSMLPEPPISNWYVPAWQSACFSSIFFGLVLNIHASYKKKTVSRQNEWWYRVCMKEKFERQPGGVGHGPRDQFCPITSLQMADWFFHLCAGSLFDFLRFSPFIKWFTIIFFGKVWVDRCSKPQFLKQYDVCLFSIDIARCNSSCA